jgi:hypothetical protein
MFIVTHSDSNPLAKQIEIEDTGASKEALFAQQSSVAADWIICYPGRLTRGLLKKLLQPKGLLHPSGKQLICCVE